MKTLIRAAENKQRGRLFDMPDLYAYQLMLSWAFYQQGINLSQIDSSVILQCSFKVRK